MLSILLLCTYLTLVFDCYLAAGPVNKEFLVRKCGDELVLQGRFLVEEDNFGKEFWLCVDYESSVERNATDWNAYPEKECGGKPFVTKNMFWYSFHGIWDTEKKDQVSLFYWSSSVFALLQHEHANPPFQSNTNALLFYQFNKDPSFRLTQTHGTVFVDYKTEDFGMVTVGFAGSTVRNVADYSNIHIRINGVGLQIEETFEQKLVGKTELMQQC